MNKENKPVAVFLMGPTASGKSAFSVQLAQAVKGEIISVDSAQVYQGMAIGTAKPSLEERGGIPHHLLDILEPSESFSTGQFRRLALQLIHEITGRGKIPILTGGTMLYFKALQGGLAELPEADRTIRLKLDEDLEQLGKDALYRRLAEVDPEAAARIHPNDPQRIQRALEVYEISGRPLSSFFKEAQTADMPFRKIKFILASHDRKILHTRIAERFKQMLEHGFVDEVEALYARGDLTVKMPSIRTVGYRQVWAYLQGEYDYQTMAEKGIIATRQLAKRQFTWLRKEKESVCFDPDEPDLLPKALDVISRQMAKTIS